MMGFDRRLFELKLQESSLQKDTQICWARLLRNYKENDGVAIFKASVDCAIEALSDHLDEVDWYCRDTWSGQGGSVTAQFVLEVVSQEIADTIEARVSAIQARLKQFMSRKGLKNRTPVLHHLFEAKKRLKATMVGRYDMEVRELEDAGAEAKNEHIQSDNSRERPKPEQEAIEPDECVGLTNAKALAIGEQRYGEPHGGALARDKDGRDRRKNVDAYIREILNKTGKRITRTDIWKAAGYHSRTEFERWERHDTKRPNKAADENFTRILREKPHLK